jgi:ethanolamine utilization protein EutA
MTNGEIDEDNGHTHGAEFAGMHAHEHEAPHWHDEFGNHIGEAMSEEEIADIQDHIWKSDNVEMTTVGVDVGSSTSHLMFSRVHMQKISEGLSTRFIVVARQVLWKSPILLTPYLDDNNIDAEHLRTFIRNAYAEAGVERANVDSGAVILTGEALKRTNARAIADLFAEESGKFVCASAGHHLEALLGANGSGSVALSRTDAQTILHVDIGGGTSKFSLVRNGEVLQTAAVSIGGRLLVRGDGGVLIRVEEPARQLAKALGIDVVLGGQLAEADEQRIVAEWVRILVDLIQLHEPSGLAADLMLTDPLTPDAQPTALTFSGGVSEFLYERETGDYGDLGRALSQELRRALGDGHLGLRLLDPGQGIRATVIGASQFTVQVSGSTIRITDDAVLPLHNLPVIHPEIDLAQDISSDEVAAAIREAAVRLDFEEGETFVALAFRWPGDPLYRRLRALAEGIRDAIPRSLERQLPIVLLTDRDVGKTLGMILKEDLGIASELVSIDGILLKEFDFVDVGEIIQPTGVVPVVVKSLLFAGGVDREHLQHASAPQP